MNLRNFIISMLAALGAFSSANAAAGQTEEITVSAAISLKSALEPIGRAFEAEHVGSKVIFNFGASGLLAKQLENGAPSEVFISAGTREMDTLEKAGLLAPATRGNVVGNTLVLIAPKDSATVQKLADLSGEKVRRIAAGNPQTVPAGNYAAQTLAWAKLTDAVASKLVRAENVRQVLTYVETGNVDAGFVYGSDAQGSAKVRVVAVIPTEAHEQIVYPAALLARAARGSEGRAFLNFLRTPSSAAVFEKAGFSLLR